MIDLEICGFITNLIDRKIVSTRQELIEIRPDLDLEKALDYLIKEDYIVTNQDDLELSVKSQSVFAAGQLFLQTSPSVKKLTDYLNSLNKDS